jgi:UDP-N-acetylglucosamine 4-epimerase
MESKVLVTGGSGFIGSHICERLVELGHGVLCFDNLITSKIENVAHLIGNEKFEFVEGDIRDMDSLSDAMEGCSHVCHQAALGSVPRSVVNPIRTNEINLVGGLNLLVCAHNYEISRFVFASSSSVYGDDPELPKVELRMGSPLSPYAVSKLAFEKYANVFHTVHGIETIGLRYFNVFGPRQSPEGAYAAVIPKFMEAIRNGVSPEIYGDGEQTRDFSFVENIVQANILALFGESPLAYGKCFNVACGETTTVKKLFQLLRDSFSMISGKESELVPKCVPKRTGDILNSLADLSSIEECLGYSPIINIEEGIEMTMDWFLRTEGEK